MPGLAVRLSSVPERCAAGLSGRRPGLRGTEGGLMLWGATINEEPGSGSRSRSC